ncbi:MAG: helix-turn-helix transcriptional regulator [Oscillospiraceae bacterium]|nr:helix-turn-helix transcriptional regulator [Oscillospiraceae bacterium]
MDVTLGQKIAKLRKEQNLTQEKLAEILNVSRQSVSKWESDAAYPETEKLIKMGNLFDCSMDYLLKEDVTERSGNPGAGTVSVWEEIQRDFRTRFKERKSQTQVFGMPLYHIGQDARGFFAFGLKARGVFAFGLRSRGLVSMGLLSVGGLSFGLLSLGLLSVGILSAGLLAVGAFALGLFAVGAISVGIVSCGALAIGYFSRGAMAIGKYAAYGDHARAMVAIGETKAVGSVYAFSDLSASNTACVMEWLDANTPRWLSLAKEIFKFFL